MKRNLKYGFSLLAFISALFTSVTSCKEDPSFTELEKAYYPAEVKLVVPTAQQALIYTDTDGSTLILPLIKGESVTLAYTIVPEETTYKDVKWSSSNIDVATIDENGKLIAVSGDNTGYSIIQVTPDPYHSGSGLAGSIKVVVANSLVKATSLNLTSPATEVYAGETIQLGTEILPTDATYKTVQWHSSDEDIATVDQNGLVTGKVNNKFKADVTITATTLDGSNTVASKVITVMQIVDPEEVNIDQTYAVDNDYLFAIADKKVILNYTTVPVECTKTRIEWTSSDEAIATVNNGEVTFNQDGIFGDATITASCPITGKSSSIKLHIEEGLVRELFHDQNNYGWYNANQSGNGTSSSHVWSYGKVTVTTYKQNATNQRGDFKCWNAKTFLSAGKYPILAIRIDDLMDMEAVTKRNITLDASGSCDGKEYKGGLNGNNNKWLNDYKCSDGSHVFIYDLSKQAWSTGGVLPTTDVASFTTFQFKYADISPLTEQVTYNVFWIQTFKTMNDLKKYIESEGLVYEIIK